MSKGIISVLRNLEYNNLGAATVLLAERDVKHIIKVLEKDEREKEKAAG